MDIERKKSFLETATIFITVATSACLCMSILYNILFFSIIGIRLDLIPMTMADHILAINSWIIVFAATVIPPFIGNRLGKFAFYQHAMKKQKSTCPHTTQIKEDDKIPIHKTFTFLLFIILFISNIIICYFKSIYYSFLSLNAYVLFIFICNLYVSKNILIITQQKIKDIYTVSLFIFAFMLTLDVYKLVIFNIYSQENIPTYNKDDQIILRALEKGVIVDTGKELKFIFYDTQNNINFPYTSRLLEMKGLRQRQEAPQRAPNNTPQKLP